MKNIALRYSRGWSWTFFVIRLNDVLSFPGTPWVDQEYKSANENQHIRRIY